MLRSLPLLNVEITSTLEQFSTHPTIISLKPLSKKVKCSASDGFNLVPWDHRDSLVPQLPILNSECCGSRQVDQIEVSGSMGFIGDYRVLLL